jgi:hypothetical protein
MEGHYLCIRRQHKETHQVLFEKEEGGRGVKGE